MSTRKASWFYLVKGPGPFSHNKIAQWKMHSTRFARSMLKIGYWKTGNDLYVCCLWTSCHLFFEMETGLELKVTSAKKW